MTEAIVQAVAPEQIGLFGSRAKELDRSDSNIGFLIVKAEFFRLNRSRRKESAKDRHFPNRMESSHSMFSKFSPIWEATAITR